MKQKIYIGAAAIVMAGIFLLAGGKPVVAKAEKIKKVKIASAEKTVLINKKEKIQLKAKVKPASMKKKVRWKSSNKKVVTVSQKGVIRGKRYGKANIWLKAADGSGKKAKIKVQVGRKVTSVSFAVKKQELEVGQKANLKPIVLPGNATDKKVTYQSSNPSVVSVSSKGTVVAKGKGEAVITARSKDGTRKSGSYVIQSRVLTKSITINGGANASNKSLRYTSSDPTVAVVSASGIVSGLEPGTAVIRVDAADGHSTANIKVEVFRMEISNQKLIAHRGFSSQAPENSIPAFEKALESGFYGIECDIWKTLDGEFMVSHDGDLNRMFGYDFQIATLTTEQIKKYFMINGSNVDAYDNLTMPTFEQYLGVMKKNKEVHPFVEIKEELNDADLRKIVKQVKDAGLLNETYFISMHQSNLLSLQRLDGVNTSQLQYVYGAEDFNKTTSVTSSVISWCINNQIDLDTRQSLVTASDVYRLQTAGRQVNVWTVNTIEKAYDLVNKLHVDMITTEYMLNTEP